MNQDEDTELSDTIKAKATHYQTPAALPGRILAAVNEVDRMPGTSSRKPVLVSLRRQWAGLVAAFACGAAVSLAVALFQVAQNEGDRLSEEVVAGHVRSLMVTHLADVASSDQHTVKPWFSGKLDFSPPVHDLAKEGFPLAGARLDYLNHRPVAALVYFRQRHAINLFVWPSSSTSTKAIKLMSRQGFNMAAWSDFGMQFWAVSDLNLAELEKFSQMVRHVGP